MASGGQSGPLEPSFRGGNLRRTFSVDLGELPGATQGADQVAVTVRARSGGAPQMPMLISTT